MRERKYITEIMQTEEDSFGTIPRVLIVVQ